jgi:hypothetical protein
MDLAKLTLNNKSNSLKTPKKSMMQITKVFIVTVREHRKFKARKETLMQDLIFKLKHLSLKTRI